MRILGKQIHIKGSVFLLSLVFISFLTGLSCAYWKLAPWKFFNSNIYQFEKFVKGHDDERETTVFEKVVHDFGGVPHRSMIVNPTYVKPGQSKTEFSFFEDGINMRGFTDNPPKGYLLLAGGFQYQNKGNTGVALISTEGEFIRFWRSHANMILGLDVARAKLLTGSRVRDWCGGTNTRGALRLRRTHHSIEVAPDGTYWTNIPDGFIQVNPDEIDSKHFYKILRRITFADIIQKNPGISPLRVRMNVKWAGKKLDPNQVQPIAEYADDPYHHNDVQPFVDPRFNSELGYSLLVSVRNQNLVFAVDPITLKILWYEQGVTEWQHDADYLDGHVYLYDNGPFRGFARLVRFSMDPKLNPAADVETIVDGKLKNWVNPIRGGQDVFNSNGRRYHLLTHERNAAAVMVDQDGETVFFVQNRLRDVPEHGLQIYASQFISVEDFQSMERICEERAAGED